MDVAKSLLGVYQHVTRSRLLVVSGRRSDSTTEIASSPRECTEWRAQCAIDLRRRRRGRETRSLEDAPAVVPSTPQQDLTKQNRSRELLERQTDTDHSILLLYLEGHLYREIGEVIGVSEFNCRNATEPS